MSEKKILTIQSLPEIENWMTSENEPKFRAKQVFEWIFQKFAITPNEMVNIPKGLRKKIEESLIFPSSKIIENIQSQDGTEKLLVELSDKECIETVVIPSRTGRITFCLSTQVGCPVGCLFCASGRNGLVRNLTAAEMIEEFLFCANRIGDKPNNIVFMGIGEGLMNFNQLEIVLDKLTDKNYFGMSPRRITVSTSGYLSGMRKLSNLGKEFNLAISLHAPDDETRAKIIPDKLRYPIKDILYECDNYREKCGRMVTFEYTLLENINDSNEQAKNIANLAKIHHAKINLIPFNQTDGEFKRPSKERINKFKDIIEYENAHVTIRTEHGSKESSACGQLRISRKDKEK